MKITICGSIVFIDEMLAAKQELEALGHEVKMPPTEIIDGDGEPLDVKTYYQLRKEGVNNPSAWLWDKKRDLILNHFGKIEWCDAVLVLNHDKNGVAGYVGANTLMEMGLALYLGKRIYMIKDIPELSYKEEILGMKPIIISELKDIH
ncbi:hypothetical protein GF352_01435 [archaeon]|nr:hypothetical protein [archaeon]